MLKNIVHKFSSVRMQLVASVFVAIAPALFLTYLVNQDWFWRFSPEWLKYYATDLPWPSFVVGLLALGASWFGGEHFILRQVRALSNAAHRLARGDLTARTGLKERDGELGQLAKTFDSMAGALEQWTRERELSQKTILNRALQQTTVASLGQFLLTNNDLPALMNQAVLLVAQTLEVEFTGVFQKESEESLILVAGIGWEDGTAGQARVTAERNSQIGRTLHSGEPVIAGLPGQSQLHKPVLLMEHGVVGGITVMIQTREESFGVFGAFTTRPRLFTADEVQFLLAVANAIGMAVEHQRADFALKKLASFAQLNPNPTLEFAADGSITYLNEAAQRLASATPSHHPADMLPEGVKEIVQECLDTGRSKLNVQTKLDGRTLSWSFHPVVAGPSVHCYVENITARLNLEDQLRQSQKMESVGQLAAGVAHDFNNMLTIIQGHSSALLARPALPAELLEPVQAVFFASERAAKLTRQLLMFSRKNVMQPRSLDLREVVGNMSKMLQRLLGETIDLQFHPPEELRCVLADPGMIEQVVMNLSVNARDALPKGGTLTISIESLTFGQGDLEEHPEARLGHFIRLRVADNGCGMDDATRVRIFEPFFTTKEVGRGTGLGLATVYGIVKQHEGWIEVHSEPQVGSVFDIFLPATEEMAGSQNQEQIELPPITGGSETILIVEDEPVLREMARDILENCGYRILEAASGREALEVWRQHTSKVQLLLTDMVMPEGVSGVDLAERLLNDRPDLKVVFTSGYTADEVNRDVLAKTRALFLQKPYSHSSLARTVRDRLDRNGFAHSFAQG